MIEIIQTIKVAQMNMLNKVTKKPILLELTEKTERERYGGAQGASRSFDQCIDLDDLTTSNEWSNGEEEEELGQRNQGLLIYWTQWSIDLDDLTTSNELLRSKDLLIYWT